MNASGGADAERDGCRFPHQAADSGAVKHKIAMTEKQVLLSTTYFGPVQWYQKLYRYDRVFIERCDTFRKQTYRNRCVIAAANGAQALTVPVERAAGAQQVRDIRISDHGNWRHIHWHALLSAYSESPFFDYYADDIRPFFERKWEFLYDYNMEICRKMCELLDITPHISPTEQYVHADDLPLYGCETGGSRAETASISGAVADFRDAIDPKHPLEDRDFAPKSYYQVYAAKHGFLPNLSVLDLLFNMGPEGIFYL